MALPPFAVESVPSERTLATAAFETFPFPPAPPISAKEVATRVSLHPDSEKFLGPNSDVIQSDLQMLELLDFYILSTHDGVAVTSITVCICSGLVLQLGCICSIMPLWYY